MGVPQGSVLSATLFIIFINDLLEKPFKGNKTAFADDIAFSYSQNIKSMVMESINYDLKILRQWCNSNFMVVNVSKTKYMNFHHHGFDFDSEIMFHDVTCNTGSTCNCQKIEKVNNFKYLGIYLDDKLSCEKHITNLNVNLRRNIRTFYYLRNLCDTDLLRSLYHALIHSRIQYGIHCWGGAFKNLIDKLAKTQKQYVRVILFKKRREASLPLFRELSVLPIKYLFVFKVLKIFYQRSGQFGNENRYEHKYQTRNNFLGSFRRPKINTALFEKSFVFLGPKCYNDLPANIKSLTMEVKFSFALKHWLLSLNDVQEILKVLG